MPDLDQWLEQAVQASRAPLSSALRRNVDLLVAAEPSPETLAAARDRRRAMLSAAVAALIGFSGSTVVATSALATPAPTWLAAPSPESPFGRLIGR